MVKEEGEWGDTYIPCSEFQNPWSMSIFHNILSFSSQVEAFAREGLLWMFSEMVRGGGGGGGEH